MATPLGLDGQQERDAEYRNSLLPINPFAQLHGACPPYELKKDRGAGEPVDSLRVIDEDCRGNSVFFYFVRFRNQPVLARGRSGEEKKSVIRDRNLLGDKFAESVEPGAALEGPESRD